MYINIYYSCYIRDNNVYQPVVRVTNYLSTVCMVRTKDSLMLNSLIVFSV